MHETDVNLPGEEVSGLSPIEKAIPHLEQKLRFTFDEPEFLDIVFGSKCCTFQPDDTIRTVRLGHMILKNEIRKEIRSGGSFDLGDGGVFDSLSFALSLFHSNVNPQLLKVVCPVDIDFVMGNGYLAQRGFAFGLDTFLS
jgi:hypothetical protein